MSDIITKILNEAVSAPSGDNSQPWRFVCSGETVDIFNMPDKDNPIFNYRQRGSYIAHGALIENITIAASALGHRAEIITLPDRNDRDHTARVTLKPDPSVTPHPLAPYITDRCTNRKKYDDRPLTNLEKAELLAAGGGRLLIEETPQKKQLVGTAASTAEYVMLQYRPLHDAFFNLINWTVTEEQRKKTGMYIKTFELLPPQEAVFKLFKNWTMARLLSALGLPKLVAKENAAVYGSSPAILALVMKGHAPEDCLETGQTLQRIWLTATKLGLSVQPIAGVLYLAQRLEEAGLPDLRPELQNRISKAVKTIYQTFSDPAGKITMILRIGRASAPSARSIKAQPTIEKKP